MSDVYDGEYEYEDEIEAEGTLEDPVHLNNRVRELEIMLGQEVEFWRCNGDRELWIDQGNLWPQAFARIFDLVNSDDEDDRAEGIGLMVKKLRAAHAYHVGAVAGELRAPAACVQRYA